MEASGKTQVIVPKKRGRKPKEKETPKEPKKRGRKPKNKDAEPELGNLAVTKNKKMKARIQETIVGLKKRESEANQKLMTNLILHIPIRSTDLKQEGEIFNAANKPLRFIADKLPKAPENVINFDAQAGTVKNGLQIRPAVNTNFNTGLRRLKKNNWPRTTDIRCWWCTYQFDSTPCSIPYKYDGEEFFVYGCFCSFECSMAHVVEKVRDKKWEKIALLNMMYRFIHGKDETIEPAPPKEILIDYGGKMTIERYRQRSCTKMISYDIVIPPIVSLQPQIEERNIHDSISQMERRPMIGMGSAMDDGTGQPNKLVTVRRGRPIANSKKFLKHFIKKD